MCSIAGKRATERGADAHTVTVAPSTVPAGAASLTTGSALKGGSTPGTGIGTYNTLPSWTQPLRTSGEKRTLSFSGLPNIDAVARSRAPRGRENRTGT